MKIIILTLLLFAGCSDTLVENETQTDNTQCVQRATVYLNSGNIEHLDYTDMEYTLIVDNNGYGFTFTNNGVFVKSYLTENIQTITTQNNDKK